MFSTKWTTLNTILVIDWVQCDGESHFQSTRTRSRSPAISASFSTTLAPTNTTPPPSRELPRSQKCHIRLPSDILRKKNDKSPMSPRSKTLSCNLAVDRAGGRRGRRPSRWERGRALGRLRGRPQSLVTRPGWTRTPSTTTRTTTTTTSRRGKCRHQRCYRYLIVIFKLYFVIYLVRDKRHLARIIEILGISFVK